MLENECKQLRRDVSAIEELKKSAEQQSRTLEQEVSALLALDFIMWFNFFNGVEIASRSCIVVA